MKLRRTFPPPPCIQTELAELYILCARTIYICGAAWMNADIVVYTYRDPNPQQTLQRRRTSESLQRHLAQRPEREELIERMSHTPMPPCMHVYMSTCLHVYMFCPQRNAIQIQKLSEQETSSPQQPQPQLCRRRRANWKGICALIASSRRLGIGRSLRC